MTEITLSPGPDCADCQAIKRLLTHQGVPLSEKNVRGNPQALAELQAKADVRSALGTVIGHPVFCGPFGDQRPRSLAALHRGGHRGGATS